MRNLSSFTVLLLYLLQIPIEPVSSFPIFESWFSSKEPEKEPTVVSETSSLENLELVEKMSSPLETFVQNFNELELYEIKFNDSVSEFQDFVTLPNKDKNFTYFVRISLLRVHDNDAGVKEEEEEDITMSEGAIADETTETTPETSTITADPSSSTSSSTSPILRLAPGPRENAQAYTAMTQVRQRIVAIPQVEHWTHRVIDGLGVMLYIICSLGLMVYLLHYCLLWCRYGWGCWTAECLGHRCWATTSTSYSNASTTSNRSVRNDYDTFSPRDQDKFLNGWKSSYQTI